MIRLVAIAIIIFETAMVWALPAEAAAQPAKAQTKKIVLHDAKRKNLALPVLVTWVAANAAPPHRPVIIFSHGAVGDVTKYQFLADCWAQHGYIVIRPEHVDSLARIKERHETVSATLDKISMDGSGWVERARDISGVIDAIPEVEKQIPAIAPLVDAKRIGVGGHALGAMIAMLLAGATMPASREKNLPSVRDPRVQALVLLSPPYLRLKNDVVGFDDKQSFQNLRTAALFVMGDHVRHKLTLFFSSGNPYTSSPAGDKYMAIVLGASDVTFLGPVAEGDSRQIMISEALNAAMEDARESTVAYERMQLHALGVLTTDFWDAYLKGNAAAKRSLQSKSGVRAQERESFQLQNR
jgi:predicted dienelactone hydrolase